MQVANSAAGGMGDPTPGWASPNPLPGPGRGRARVGGVNPPPTPEVTMPSQRTRTAMSTERTTEHPAEAAEPPAGVAQVMAAGVRVAGPVPTRVDLRFAGTPEQQVGVSLGTVLVYESSYLTARTIALAWGQAAPMARSLSPVLPAARRPVLATGPWSVSMMVRMFGIPAVDTMLMGPSPGTNLPTMLRMQVGPITWELADAAAYVSLLKAWRTAADVLAPHAEE
ncbi:MAG: hypothetical protein L0I76_33995 [Pseudonocardia sp.]|nr:hypothetical protein [Pseudonocardia sp.]